MQLGGLCEFIDLIEHLHFLILFSATVSRLLKSCREEDVKGDGLLFHTDLIGMKYNQNRDFLSEKCLAHTVLCLSL